MEVKFKDHVHDRLETDAGFTAGFSTSIVTMYRKRLQLIRAAADERAFYALKSLHFEKLKGDRAGQYSMRLNDQWRLIIELVTDSNGKTVVVIDIADYH
ncbi:type II toxin-antitoxin system RelE/ParE family toxin [Collimonas silvisoli]|uniref:type II toxin-antitoxin system RelE/ParE family toxin n=1 Tax=Collimonas silvisoli TaxID=2825884 RepID=UPI001B8C5E01|nr:type II toxin-antitoxin system RelE/ParE family toxin [Collimonas silvisoli]